MNAATDSSAPAVVSPPVVALPKQLTRPTGAHPAAELFPMMKDIDLGLLVEDIDEHGLREPILVCQGLVLDGRNRLRACEIAGVEPRFTEWDGVGSPLAIVLSRNLHRRHLNEGQRAIIAARAKGMFEDEAAERQRACQFGQESGIGSNAPENGENAVAANLQRPGRATAKAAELLNVSERSVASASRVLKSADEQVIAAVESGDVAVSDAASIMDLSKDEQRVALGAKREGRARTLRQAAEEFGESSGGSGASQVVAPTTGEAGGTPAPQSSRKALRREAKRFTRDIEKLLRRLDTFIAACGGPNDQTQQMRDCLRRLVDIFHDFARHHLAGGK